MSEERQESEAEELALQSGGAEGQTETQAGGLSELMQDDPQQRLEAEAISAAQSAIEQGEAAVRAAQQIPTEQGGRENRRIWALRGFLALNLALMVVMLLIPDASHQDKPEPESAASHGPSAVEPEPIVHTPKTPEDYRGPHPGQLGLVGEQLMDQALSAAGEHNYARAIELLERYIEQPGVPEAKLELAYVQLRTYCTNVGRVEDASHWGNLAQNLTPTAHLPEELVRAAEAAERNGDGRAMRRAYARFLLISDRVAPSQYAKIVEAYLKMGESFSLEASGSGQSEPSLQPREVEALRERKGGH